MTALAAQIDFALMLIPPPKADLAFAVVSGDLKSLEKRVGSFEQEALEWRIGLVAGLRKVLSQADAGIKDIQEEEKLDVVRRLFFPLNDLFEGMIRDFSTPMHVEPEFATKIEEISKLSSSAGKFVRKLMRRVEKIRVAQYNACIDVYYALLAFQSEFDRESTGPSFTDGNSAEEFLRKQFV